MGDRGDNVRSLTAAATKPDDELIAKLEESLGRARRGEIHSVAVVELLNDRCMSSWWHKPNNASLIALIGALGYLKHRMFERFE